MEKYDQEVVKYFQRISKENNIVNLFHYVHFLKLYMKSFSS